MKNWTMTFVAILALGWTAQAQENTCSDHIKQSVENQAKLDFPQEQLMAIMPSVFDDGGSVETYKIPMIDPQNPNKTVVTYGVMVGETCQIMSLYQVR